MPWIGFCRPERPSAGRSSIGDLKYYELRLGHKKVYGMEQQDGRVRIVADCDECGPAGMVQFHITKAQAEEFFTVPRLRHAQDIAPELPLELREVLITGSTPMEGEFMRGIEPDYTLKRYKGVYVVDCPECGKPTSEMVLTPQGYFCTDCIVHDNQNNTSALAHPG